MQIVPLNIINIISPHQFLSVNTSSCWWMDPLFGTSPAYHPHWGFANPMGTLLELQLPATSLTPCTWRGAPSALQTLCLRGASAALGVLHARLYKSSSLWMLGRNDWTFRLLWWRGSTLGRSILHLKEEHSAPHLHTELHFMVLLPHR